MAGHVPPFLRGGGPCTDGAVSLSQVDAQAFGPGLGLVRSGATAATCRASYKRAGGPRHRALLATCSCRSAFAVNRRHVAQTLLEVHRDQNLNSPDWVLPHPVMAIGSHELRGGHPGNRLGMDDGLDPCGA